MFQPLRQALSQPSQNGPAASSTNRLLWEFDRLLAIRKCVIFTNNKEKRKKKTKKTERTFQPERKVPKHYSKGLKVLV